METRKAYIETVYEGTDITREITQDMLSFSYTDNASGQADNISLNLQDRDGRWLKNWFPGKGDIIAPIIRTNNWLWEGHKQKLFCGQFIIDEPEYSGRPRQLSINGVSAPLNDQFKETKRTKTWRNITLYEIAREMALRSGLNLETYLEGNNPLYTSKEQSEETDASFLSELCGDEGLAMKVTDHKIIIFDEAYFEKRNAVATIRESASSTLDYSFKTSLSKTAYKGVQIDYYDSEQGRNISYLYSIDEIDKDSKVYKMNERVKSGSEAKRRAQKKFRELNKVEYTGKLKVVGNVNLVGAACVQLEEFGIFSGKYYIQAATHNIGNGYTTDIEIRKVLGG